MYVNWFHYTFENINVEQLPPNPNEFDNTYLISFSIVLVVGFNCVFSITSSKFKFANAFCSFKDSIENTASIPPAAANVCPVNALVELNIGTSLKTLFSASLSEASLFGVHVPCALI